MSRLCPNNVLTIDFETYWDNEYTLSKIGPVEYIRDERFAIQLCGVRLGKGEVEIYTASDSSWVSQFLNKYKYDIERGELAVVAHNGNGFDYLILSEILGVRPRFMYDTIPMMRWVGLSRLIPESHSALTKHFCNGVKEEGTAVSCGKHWPYDFSRQEQLFFERYCKDDVLQCSENFYAMLPYMTEDALQFSSITARMATEPVFWLMPGMLQQYIQELDQKAEDAMCAVSRLFMFNSQEDFLKAVRSKEKFAAMLRQLGQEPPMKVSAKKTETARNKLEAARAVAVSQNDNVSVEKIDAMLFNTSSYAVYDYAFAKTDLAFTSLLDHPDNNVALLVQTRLAQNSSIQRSRAERFLSLSRTNSPLPIMLNAFKAHTSRFTAGNSEGATDGTQMQNLSKRDPKLLTLRKAIRVPHGYKVIAVDSSQIEARILAYVANQFDLVQQFANGEDPYSQLAEKISGIPWKTIKAGAAAGDKKMKTLRNVGKTGILSAGYQVGWRKFSDTLLRSGTKLDGDLDKHCEQAKHAWTIYRMSNQNIVQFWSTCQQVIEHLERGGTGIFGGPNNNLFEYGIFNVCGGDPTPSIKLPSGFILRYPWLRCEVSDYGKPEYYYDRVRGRNKISTKIYGGSLCENLCQSLAFQLLMWQACRMDDSGVVLKSNNHDAWITVHEDEYAALTKRVVMQWMDSVPSWLPGFPVACEGEIGNDYTIA